MNTCETLTQRSERVFHATQPHDSPSATADATYTPAPIDEAWMTCGARCQTPNPTAGQIQPRIAFSGLSSRPSVPILASQSLG